jgi:hypothetical protein
MPGLPVGRLDHLPGGRLMARVGTTPWARAAIGDRWALLREIEPADAYIWIGAKSVRGPFIASCGMARATALDPIEAARMVVGMVVATGQDRAPA